MKRRSFWIALFAVFALVLVGLAPLSASAHGNGKVWKTLPLSQKQFEAYCKNKQGGKLVVVSPGDSASLRCKAKGGAPVEIDPADMCSYTYRKLGVYLTDRLTNPYKPFGWSCMRDVQNGYQGSPDMDSWCKTQKMRLFYWPQSRYEAFGSFCANPYKKLTRSIGLKEMDQSCRFTNGRNSLARVPNPHSDYVECRKVL